MFRKIWGESDSVSKDTCDRWKRKLSTFIKNYETNNVFNAHETDLFYKFLPDKLILFKTEKCHGVKRSKERATILLTTNMIGMEKLKPSVIGK